MNIQTAQFIPFSDVLAELPVGVRGKVARMFDSYAQFTYGDGNRTLIAIDRVVDVFDSVSAALTPNEAKNVDDLTSTLEQMSTDIYIDMEN